MSLIRVDIDYFEKSADQSQILVYINSVESLMFNPLDLPLCRLYMPPLIHWPHITFLKMN